MSEDRSPVVHDNGCCTARCRHEAIDPAEIVLCRAWLRRWAVPRKSINKTRGSSYAFKHDVEEEARSYVSNGAFIVAAQLEGYSVVVTRGSPNAYFNIGVRKLPLSALSVSPNARRDGATGSR